MVKASKYTYVLPDDYTLDEATRAALDALVEKANLSNEDAQALLDLHVQMVDKSIQDLLDTVAMRFAIALIGALEKMSPKKREPMQVNEAEIDMSQMSKGNAKKQNA